MIFDITMGASAIIISDYSNEYMNKNAKSNFMIKFIIQNKGIWRGESIIFNLGSYDENVDSVDDLKCIILERDGITQSHKFESISLGTLNNLRIKAKQHIYDQNSEYFLKCWRFRTPTIDTALPITSSI